MKIGIYGGSFNPPHLGHMSAACTAMRELGLDKLLIVPAGDPPHKSLPAESATPQQRLEMAAIMADQIDAECWDVEIKRGGVSYTVDTLAEAKKIWPDADLWLLTGTDMFFSLQSWREPERITELANICAFARENASSGEAFAAQKKVLEETYGAHVKVISNPNVIEISSTEVRKEIAGGTGRDHLHDAVYGYILREKLYGTFADLKRLTIDELRCVSYSMVKAKRLPHIKGTEKAAVELAERWGANPEKLRKAAILHDCTKYVTKEEHLTICQRYGIELDDMERDAEKLLHSKSGAALAKYVFGQDDEVFTAILYHTTGRGNMSLAEKILYLADYMEPCRNFPEVHEMRRLSEIDLDQAVLMGVQLSIQEMLDRNRMVHHNTLEAESSLMKGMAE